MRRRDLEGPLRARRGVRRRGIREWVEVHSDDDGSSTDRAEREETGEHEDQGRRRHRPTGALPMRSSRRTHESSVAGKGERSVTAA
jgi:hypothetical protein